MFEPAPAVAKRSVTDANLMHEVCNVQPKSSLTPSFVIQKSVVKVPEKD